MNHIDVMKQALEVLENGMRFVWSDPEREAGFKAIDALRTAIEQAEQKGN